jgi:hypothetical protein
MLQQLCDATRDTPWPGHEAAGVEGHRNLPGRQQKRDKGNWTEAHRQGQILESSVS